MPVHWLLCDYGNVLCLDQSEQDRLALAGVAGLAADRFSAAYWATRDTYDRGDLSAAAYWAGVCGAPVAPDRLERLVALDVVSWTHPNGPVLATLRKARRAGLRTALLSNAPVEIARAAERLDWLEGFAPRVFSCDVGETKPASAVYARALARLAAPAGDVVFVDDRAANVAAAAELGIVAVQVSAPARPEELEALLAGRQS